MGYRQNFDIIKQKQVVWFLIAQETWLTPHHTFLYHYSTLKYKLYWGPGQVYYVILCYAIFMD